MKTSNSISSGLLGLALAASVMAPIEAVRAGHFDQVGLIENTWDGVAIKGYDPVAYFKLGAAVRGAKEFNYEWLGQTWHFSSAEHRDLFTTDPVKYVPQFGGYCSESHNVADINPAAWRVVGGRLYLFYSEDSAGKFETDDRGQAKAAKYWKTVKAGLSQ
jgi:YHS domain-containing protein